MRNLRAVATMQERHHVFRLDRAALEWRQLAKFRRLAAHAIARSPWYARIARERAIDPARARPEDFPPLTKQDCVAHFDELSTRPRVRRAVIEGFLASSTDARRLLDGQYHVLHTSGTSGHVSYAVFRRDEWARGATQFTRIARAGWRRRIAFIGAAAGHYAAVSLARARVPLVARLVYNRRAFDLHQPVDDLIRDLNAFQPRVLTGYARGLAVLAEFQQAGALRIRPRAVFAGGETLVASDAAAIEHAFGTRPRTVYATSEHMYMGVSAPNRDEVYLFEDDLIFEIEANSVLVTNLFNFTVPMIRHRLHDVLRPTGGHNGPFQLISPVLGRTEAVPFFVNEDGRRDFIHPIVISEFYAPRLRAFQMHVLDDRSFRFTIVLEPNLARDERHRAGRDVRDRLSALLARKRMRNVRFDVDEVETLPAPRRGKFRLVVPPPV